MKKIHPSKIDWWLGIPLLFPIYKGLESIVEGEWWGWLVLVGVVLLVVFFCKTTRYIIDHDQLIVKSMWMVHEKIQISSIRKIERSNSVLSSPALSLDRIAVKYNKFDEIYLSPADRYAFAEDLKAINGDIAINF